MYTPTTFGDSNTGNVVAFDEFPARLRNTIVSGNRATLPETGAATSNCSGAIVSEGHNLENGPSCGFTAAGDLQADPKPSQLDDWDGPTNAHMVLPGSTAVGRHRRRTAGAA